MKMPVNKFRKALQKDRPLFGVWQGLPTATAAEICAAAGFDWVVIDNEHAPLDVRQSLVHLQAVAGYDVAPICRVVEGTTALIKQYLDIGVQTLIVPMVEDAEQARGIVSATRYAPAGTRGMGSALARASRWTLVPDYAKQADESVFLIVQVESASALNNIDEILEVEGVDSVFIGPADLSASLGYPGNAGHPEVRAAIATALGKIRSAGKIAGILCGNEADARRAVDQGANFVGVGIDTVILAKGARALVEQYISE